MKISVYLLLLMLILCAPASLGFSWVQPYEVHDIGSNLSFYFDIDYTWELVIVYIEEEKHILNIPSCLEYSIYEICFNDTEYNLTEGKGGIFNTIRKPAVLIDTEEQRPTLTFERDIQTETPIVNNKKKIDIVLSNSGNKVAESIRYIEKLPPEFEVVSMSSGFTIIDNLLVWRGIISDGENKKLYYTYKPKSTGKFSLETTLEYAYNNRKFEKIIDPIIISPIEVISINASLQNDSIELGKNISLEIKIKNMVDNDIRVSRLAVEMPNELNDVWSGKLKKEKESYVWSGTIDSLETESFNIYGEATKTGNPKITYALDVYISNVKYEFTDVINFDIDFNPLIAEISFINETLHRGMKEDVIVYLRNTNKNTEIMNITCLIYNNTQHISTKSVETLKSGSSTMISKFEFVGEEAVVEKYYQIEVLCEHFTPFNEKIDVSDKKIIKVLPSEKNEDLITDNLDDGGVLFGSSEVEEETEEPEEEQKETAEKTKKISLLKKIILLIGSIFT